MSIKVNPKKAVVNVGLCLLSMAGLVSCSTDESFTEGLSDDAITFTTNVTRAYDQTWESGDKIGVYMFDENTSSYVGENKAYTISDTKGTFIPSSSTDALNWPKDGSAVKFLAYYPYSATAVANGVYNVDVSKQSKDLDLMYAPTDAAYTKGDGQPSLKFSHQMAQVTVSLTSTDGKDLSDVKVTLQKVPTTAEYTFSKENSKSGTFTSLSTKQNVEMYHVSGTGLTSNDKAVFRAFLIPGTYSEGINLVLSDGSKTTTAAPLKDGSLPLKELASGSTYTFDIANVKGLGGTSSNTSSAKANYFMEIPTLTDPNLQNKDLVYKTYTFDKGRGEERNYSMLFDKTRKMALWVAYPLNSSYTGNIKRPKDWSFAPGISEADQIDVRTKSYLYDQVYNRGHQLPNGDRNGNATAQNQTFFVTNQTPQAANMNGGIWRNLEDYVRKLSEDTGVDTLFVVTGPLFEGAAQYTPTKTGQSVQVPSAYFKAIATVTRTKDYKQVTFAKTIAWIIPNTDDVAKNDYTTYQLPVAGVEKRTGYILFPAIPEQYKTTITWK